MLDPKRKADRIQVVTIKADHVADLRLVPTEILIHYAEAGDLFARAFLLHFRRRLWKGEVN